MTDATPTPPAPDEVAGPAPADEPSCPHEPELDPLSKEFFIGLVSSMLAVILGVYLAAQAGFDKSARFALLEDHHAARTTLALVRSEFVANTESVRAARKGLRDKRPFIPLELRTVYLEAAAGKPSMALVDPTVMTEIERSYAYPLPVAFTLTTGRGRRSADTDAYAIKIYTQFLERGEEVVVPLLDRAERALAAAEAQLKARQ